MGFPVKSLDGEIPTLFHSLDRNCSFLLKSPMTSKVERLHQVDELMTEKAKAKKMFPKTMAAGSEGPSASSDNMRDGDESPG
jgi:hypothetical protein